MLSINTNLSSIIAQNSMKTTTDKLNQAIERMSTGYKINHAKDNAANYAISTDMTTKIGAYQVAEDNCAQGLDMVSTASESLSLIQDKLERLRALATQASNGTYGGQSLNAIQSEANAITKEIERLYNTAQYNGVKLFSQKEWEIASHLPQAGESGFIDEGVNIGGYAGVNAEAKYNGFIENPVTYTDSRLAEMFASGHLVVLETDLESFTSGKSYLIKDKAQLEHLAELVNKGKSTTNVTFILGEDIDLEGEEWTPIGDYSTNTSYVFRGTFDGNGHKISNLKIDNPTADYQGLFGYTSGAEIKNISLEGGQVEGNSRVGFLVGASGNSTISNSYSTGSVTGQGYNTGGLVGVSNDNSTITNSYSTASVTGQGDYTGGLVGYNYSNSTISNCYSIGNVTGQGNHTGGLVGLNSTNSTIKNSYATGDVTGQGNFIGGLVGMNNSSSTITCSYAIGDVIGQTDNTGGLVGYNNSGIITNSYATGDVSGQGNCVGGLVASNNNSSTITNCYALGVVTGQRFFVGGLVGGIISPDVNMQIIGCAAYGSVNSTSQHSGSLIGRISNTADGVNFTNVSITNCQVMPSDKNVIGTVTKDGAIIIPDYDMSSWLNEISEVKIRDLSTNLQVGVNANNSCQLNFNTNFKFDLSAFDEGISSAGAFSAIDDFLNLLSEKQTMLGSVTNRLESVLDEIEIQYSNLASSRSTIRDADMAELSSTYIQQQILQQAASTLMSTANQSPAIALQLI